MMRWSSSIWLLLLLLSPSLQALELSPAEQAWLSQGHKVRVRYSDFPPLHMRENGEPSGISVDLIRRVANDAGEPKLGAQSLKAVQSARYRPRFENGAPVETTGVRLDQPYYVEVEEPKAAAPGS